MALNLQVAKGPRLEKRESNMPCPGCGCRVWQFSRGGSLAGGVAATRTPHAAWNRDMHAPLASLPRSHMRVWPEEVPMPEIDISTYSYPYL